MSSLWNRVKEFAGFGDSDVYEDEDFALYGDEKRDETRRPTAGTPVQEAESAEAPPSPAQRRRPARSGNVIGMPGSGGGANEVLVIEPRSFDEAPAIVQHLRDRKSVILNLTLMDSDQAQRSVDFVAGATFAIDGHQERVGEGIFLFTPSTVMISTEMPSQLRNAAQGFGSNFRMNAEEQRRAQG